ncbi:chymotrypsin BI-like, partial [Aethina tumida]|uniref:chymotrypsin BI-like n=1 Tax=Aethina tumida TaxID=116153 RepID=UPI0021494551
LDQRRISENITEYFKTFQQSRIIGGTEAPKHSSPWQAALIIDSQGFCGGSLISKNYVLTAGHCTSEAESILVILGAHNVEEMESTKQLIWSASITTHSNYRNTLSGPVNDIGVVQLSTPAVLNSYVKVVPLAKQDVAATLSGWGRTTDDSWYLSPVLMRVNLTTIGNMICQFQVLRLKAIIRNTCTSGRGTKGGCNGDSGGALISNDVQIGIVSFGGSECERGMPSVFTRVSQYETWIAQNTDVSL